MIDEDDGLVYWQKQHNSELQILFKNINRNDVQRNNVVNNVDVPCLRAP